MRCFHTCQLWVALAHVREKWGIPQALRSFRTTCGQVRLVNNSCCSVMLLRHAKQVKDCYICPDLNSDLSLFYMLHFPKSRDWLQFTNWFGMNGNNSDKYLCEPCKVKWSHRKSQFNLYWEFYICLVLMIRLVKLADRWMGILVIQG